MIPIKHGTNDSDIRHIEIRRLYDEIGKRNEFKNHFSITRDFKYALSIKYFTIENNIQVTVQTVDTMILSSLNKNEEFRLRLYKKIQNLKHLQ